VGRTRRHVATEKTSKGGSTRRRMLGGAPTTKGATRGEPYLATQARACAVSKPALWTACERPRRRRKGAWAAAAGAPRRRRVGA